MFRNCRTFTIPKLQQFCLSDSDKDGALNDEKVGKTNKLSRTAFYLPL